MLLAVDIGNSNIKFGAYDGESLVTKFSIPTRRSSTTEDLRSAIAADMPGAITKSLVCSVVPELNGPLSDFFISDFGVRPVIVTNDFDFGLQINYTPLSAAGTDRLVNSFSAVEKYGAPCIVCSFGTALTIDVIATDRELIGGLIAPGIKPLAIALKQATSQLPEVNLVKPTRVLQNTTVSSIQSGVFNGYLGMFEGLIRAVKKEIDDEPQIIATGGFAETMAGQTSQIDIVDRNLTLDGLMLLARQ